MTASVESPANQTLDRGFELGTVRIDPRSGAASGPAGTEKLDPKVMAVLVALAERAGYVVGRDELLSRIWPDVVVGDEVLSRCIYELRRQLSLAAGDVRIKEAIETLPKRGYRLNGEVTPLSPAQPRAEHRSRSRPAIWTVTGLSALVVSILGYRALIAPSTSTRSASGDEYSIAVLPFSDLSETQDQAFLADGFAEEILDKLSQNTDLRVIARTSSFSFRGQSADIEEIARKLDVTHVLEGSVRRSGDSLRITAQLIATEDSSHVWSTSFDRRMGDLFTIQHEIAEAVANALSTSLGDDRPDASELPTLAAYDLVKQAEYLYFRRAPGDLDRSIELFEQALKFDPHYARAWAALAAAYSMQAQTVDPPSDALRAKQGQAAIRAVELDPSLALAHARLAQYYGIAGEEELFRSHLDRAFKLDPNDPLVLSLTASETMYAGDYVTALALQRRAVVRDPMNSVYRQNLGVMLAADGRLEESFATFRFLTQINPDLDPDVQVEIPRLLALMGRYKEAAPEAVRLPAGEIRDHALAFLHRSADHRKEADAALRRFEEHVQVSLSPIPEHLVADSLRLAENYADRGMDDAAFETLGNWRSRLATHPEAAMHLWRLRYELRVSPFLKPLHKDPRWIALMADPQ
jgi:TolB-like protein/DNA-binding winged helix-turn-helix (wHTH) protein/cytochrome c-type biogenesis protein CcmH/NrfG